MLWFSGAAVGIVGGMATKDVLGKHGEQLAADYLQQRGYVVLCRNWRCRDGEIDIVATDRDRLVVCEVKTRSDGQFGAPAEAVTTSKAWRIRRVTQVWMAEHRLRWCETRFDVLAVLMPPDGLPVVQHYEAAF